MLEQAAAASNETKGLRHRRGESESEEAMPLKWSKEARMNRKWLAFLRGGERPCSLFFLQRGPQHRVCPLEERRHGSCFDSKRSMPQSPFFFGVCFVQQTSCELMQGGQPNSWERVSRVTCSRREGNGVLSAKEPVVTRWDEVFAMWT